jgi:hypothetical protein
VKKINLVIPLALLICVIGSLAGYRKGRRDVWIEQFKVYSGILIDVTNFRTNASPELIEFLKARYYYVANKLPENWIGTPYDYGDINTNLLQFSIGKGPTTATEEYRHFKDRGIPMRSVKRAQ